VRSPAVGVLVLLLAQNLLPQTPPTAASVPAVVEGVIVNLASGEPIERAVVELRRTPQSRTVATLSAQPNTEAAALVRLLESGGPLPPQLTSDPAFPVAPVTIIFMICFQKFAVHSNQFP